LRLNGQTLSPAPDLLTPLTDLNGGAGGSVLGGVGDDLGVTPGGGAGIDVGLGSFTQLGGGIDAMQAKTTKVVATLSKTGLVLTDNTGEHKNPFSVTSLDGSTAAADLGIDESPIGAPVDFNFDLGGLASLDTKGSNVFLQADVSAGFTLGVL